MISFENYPCYSCDERKPYCCESDCEELNEWHTSKYNQKASFIDKEYKKDIALLEEYKEFLKDHVSDKKAILILQAYGYKTQYNAVTNTIRINNDREMSLPDYYEQGSKLDAGLNRENFIEVCEQFRANYYRTHFFKYDLNRLYGFALALGFKEDNEGDMVSPSLSYSNVTCHMKIVKKDILDNYVSEMFEPIKEIMFYLELIDEFY